MNRTCFICGSKGLDLIKIPKKNSSICLLCIDKLEKHKDKWQKAEIDSENNICNLCFMNPPSYYDITKIPLQKICYHCASDTISITKSDTKMFLSLKWSKIVKNHSDLIKYNQIKGKLASVKKGCKNFINSVDEKIIILDDYKKVLDKKIESLFNRNLLQIEDYQKEMLQFLTIIQNEAKSDVQDGILSKSRTRGGHLFRSEAERKEIFNKNICDITPVPRQISQIFENFAKISVIPTNELFFDDTITIFHYKYPCIMFFSTEDHRIIEHRTDETIV